jgi:hypothetical protein
MSKTRTFPHCGMTSCDVPVRRSMPEAGVVALHPIAPEQATGGKDDG